MRRVARWVFAVFCALSLLLSIAGALLWARSYSGTDYVARRESVSRNVTEGYRVAWTRGDVRVSRTRDTYYPDHEVDLAEPDAHGVPPPAHWDHGRLGVGHLGWDALPGQSFWNRLGFHTFDGGMSASFADWQEAGFAFPAWLPVALFALPPLLLVRRIASARRRARVGQCRNCGYDLRASPGRCPECGAEPTQPMGATS
jgi:hypothetical protein